MKAVLGALGIEPARLTVLLYQLVKLFKDSFRVVKPIKPKASRDRSSETFLVGIGPKTPATTG